jgi:hypothetical protein
LIAVPASVYNIAFILEEMKKRHDAIGGRIRLLMNPQCTTAELKQNLKRSIARIGFDHLLTASDIDETGLIPSLFYSIASDERTGFMEKTLTFCSFYARDLAIMQYDGKIKDESIRLFYVSRQSTTAAVLGGHIFEKSIHQFISEHKRKTFDAKLLVKNGKNIHFRLSFEFSDYPKNLFNKITVTTSATGKLTTVKIVLPTGSRTFDMKCKLNSKQVGWANLVPSQIVCPDFDAIQMPLIIRQDTINSSHPFHQARVEEVATVLRGYLARFKAFKVVQGALSKAELPMFPWFVYFVPSDVYVDFRFQPPHTIRGTEVVQESKDAIPQFAVSFPISKKEMISESI